MLVVQRVFGAKRTNLHEKYDYPLWRALRSLGCAPLRDGVHLLVWADSVMVHRSIFPGRPECEAYAAIHGGIIVRLWPTVDRVASSMSRTNSPATLMKPSQRLASVSPTSVSMLKTRVGL